MTEAQFTAALAVLARGAVPDFGYRKVAKLIGSLGRAMVPAGASVRTLDKMIDEVLTTHVKHFDCDHVVPQKPGDICTCCGFAKRGGWKRKMKKRLEPLQILPEFFDKTKASCLEGCEAEWKDDLARTMKLEAFEQGYNAAYNMLIDLGLMVWVEGEPE